MGRGRYAWLHRHFLSSQSNTANDNTPALPENPASEGYSKFSLGAAEGESDVGCSEIAGNACNESILITPDNLEEGDLDKNCCNLQSLADSRVLRELSILVTEF